jgi:uncharacterized cupredoxin-like copper-binding protein
MLMELGAAGLVAVLPAHAASSARQTAADYPRLEITARDYRFELPARVSAGYTEITLTNAGPATHHAMFMRLHPGKTVDDFMKIAQHEDVGALFSISTSAGGPGSVDQGQKSTAILNLTPGQYVVICIVPGADGMPHYKMGMLAPLTVSQATQKGKPPAASMTIDLVDFSFANLPGRVEAGRQIWKVVDTGKQLHEIILNRIAPGVSFAQIEKTLMAAPPDSASTHAGPPPFVGMAGIAPMNTGETNWAVLDLTPGDYFAICFVPDIKTGKPHFELGMIMPFTVKPRKA